jgi:hypothetical protein
MEQCKSVSKFFVSVPGDQAFLEKQQHIENTGY